MASKDGDNNDLTACQEPWRKYREDLISQKLELERQVDKIVFAISTGTVGVSLAILDKITPSKEYWGLYFLLAFGWLSLILSILFQTFSINKVAKKVKTSISKVEEIITAKFLHQFEVKENEYYETWDTLNSKIDRLNKFSLGFMVFGVFLVVSFSFLSLYAKEDKPTDEIHPINIVISDSLNKHFMSKEKKPDSSKSNSSSDSSKKGYSDKSSKIGGSSKQAEQIRTPPIRVKPKGKS